MKRIYEPVDDEDGLRVLVDRVWPRGMTKERAAADLWLKEVGPSHALRTWFGHDPAKWDEFKRRYFAELDDSPEGLDELRNAIKRQSVTLLYSARDERHNQAVALCEYLERC